jgi:hypothetical protein
LVLLAELGRQELSLVPQLPLNQRKGTQQARTDQDEQYLNTFVKRSIR